MGFFARSVINLLYIVIEGIEKGKRVVRNTRRRVFVSVVIFRASLRASRSNP